MTVGEYIEWLKTMPQGAKVQTLEHTDNHGYYMQGGSCTVVDFHSGVEYQQWKDVDDNTDVEYIYGTHFELSKHQGEYILQIGVHGK